MNLPIFHDYLKWCFFQTFQMQDSKYIELKQKDGFLITQHNSWLIDQNFLEKHSKNNLTSTKKVDVDEEKVKEYRKKVKFGS